MKIVKKAFLLFFVLTSITSISNLWAQETSHLYFDGFNDYVETQNKRLDYVNEDFTLEAIIKGNEEDQGHNPTILSNKLSNIRGAAFYFRDTPDGPRALCFSNRGEEWYVPNNGSRGSLLDGECHHVAVVRSDGDYFFYADGLLFGIVYDPTCTNGLKGFRSIQIGRDRYEGNAFKGVIGKVRVWGVARTGTELYENMNASLEGTETGLKGCWELNEGTGQAIFEKVANSWSGWNGNGLSEDFHDGDWFSGDYCATVDDYGHGDDDGWVAEEEEEEEEEDVEDDQSVSIKTNSFTNTVSIFPNPISTEILTIDLGNDYSDITISLITLSGQEIVKTRIIEETAMVSLDLGQAESGVYLLIIQQEHVSFTEKLVIN